MAFETNTDYYSTPILTTIWPDLASFKSDYTAIMGIIGGANVLTESNQNALFYLMYSKHGNDPIMNQDVNQFKFKFFAVVFEFGGQWQQKLKIQRHLESLELNSDDIMIGNKNIYNRAMNPSTKPTTATLNELTYINEQNTANTKRGKLDALQYLWEMLKATPTEDFLKKFDKLFAKFVRPERHIIYSTDEESDI
jgi:hypothetical protein